MLTFEESQHWKKKDVLVTVVPFPLLLLLAMKSKNDSLAFVAL